MKRLSYVLALLGLLIALLLVAYYGLGNVVSAVSRIGWPEFGVILGWQIVLFVILGLAWDVITPATNHAPALGVDLGPHGARRLRQLPAILPSRRVRVRRPRGNACTASHGTPQPRPLSSMSQRNSWPRSPSHASGSGFCWSERRASGLAVPAEVGIGLAVLACFGFVWAQQGAAPLFARLGRRIAGRWFENAEERMDVLQAELGLIYGHAGKLALGFLMHLIGWIGTGVAGWIAYRALAVPIDFDDALAIEALLSAAAAVAFLVPVNAGVQEAGYAGLGAIFGVPPEMSLAVSLVRRARDIAIGVPILLLWQFVEMRRLRMRRASTETG